MGVLREILDAIDDLDDKVFDNIEKRFSGKNIQRSMSRAAADGTLQFPLIASRAISFPTVQRIANAHERNAASFAQIVFSMHPEMNTAKDQNGFDYLSAFHQNADTEDDAFNLVASRVNESYCVGARIVPLEGPKMHILKEELTAYGIDWREGSLNDVAPAKHLYDNKFNFPKSVAEQFEMRRRNYKAVTEADKSKKNYGDVYFRPDGDVNIDKVEGKIKADHMTTVNANPNITINSGSGKQTEIVLKDMLKDNDVKKSNELVPTLLHIRVVAVDKDKSGDGRYVDFVVGVKAMIHPVSTDDMIENLVDACRNHDGIFKFIRWTTGEISFLKDFLFNMNAYRKDVARQADGSSPWWNRLKHMANISRMKAAAFLGKQMIPNAAIVVTQEEVDLIKNQYGFDLMNPAFVEKIMKKFFLMTFIVVDDSIEVAHFKYDGQKSYQTVSYSGLEKENSNSARQFKDILRAVQRM